MVASASCRSRLRTTRKRSRLTRRRAMCVRHRAPIARWTTVSDGGVGASSLGRRMPSRRHHEPPYKFLPRIFIPVLASSAGVHVGCHARRRRGDLGGPSRCDLSLDTAQAAQVELHYHLDPRARATRWRARRRPLPQPVRPRSSAYVRAERRITPPYLGGQTAQPGGRIECPSALTQREHTSFTGAWSAKEWTRNAPTMWR